MKSLTLLGLLVSAPAFLAATCAPSDGDQDGYTLDEGDCDDTDAAVNPGMPEVCADGIDQDCDGVADEGCAGAPAFEVVTRSSRIEVYAGWLPQDPAPYEEQFDEVYFGQEGVWSQELQASAGQVFSAGIQESDTRPDRLSATLRSRADGPAGGTSALGETYAVTDLQVGFELAEDTWVAFDMAVDIQEGASAGYTWAFVRLDLPTGGYTLIDAEDGAGGRVWEELLVAGRYDLTASAYARVDLVQGGPAEMFGQAYVRLEMVPLP